MGFVIIIVSLVRRESPISEFLTLLDSIISYVIKMRYLWVSSEIHENAAIIVSNRRAFCDTVRSSYSSINGVRVLDSILMASHTDVCPSHTAHG